MALAIDDILAIQKLAAEYNHRIDSGDGDGFAALFVDDGSLDTGSNSATGTDELRKFGNAVPTMVQGIRHIVTNVSIDGDGDNATMKAYVQAWVTAGGAAGTKLIVSGIYSDTLRRDGGTWRFVARKMSPDT